MFLESLEQLASFVRWPMSASMMIWGSSVDMEDPKSPVARRLDRCLGFDSCESFDLCDTEVPATEVAKASILDSELAILCKLCTLSAEICTLIFECDSILSRTTFCSSVLDRDAAVPVSSLLSRFSKSTAETSSVLSCWFSLRHIISLEVPSYLPRTVRLSSMACLCLSSS